MDRLDSMRVFVAVAEAQGFAPAARQLGFSPPAVTRAIAALEQRIGAQLLLRTTRRVRPTEAGERFFADCKRILAELEEAETSAGGTYAEPQGQLAVTAPSMFGRLHVAQVVLDFLAQHPRVSVRTFFIDRIVNLVDEGFDVAVRIAHLPDSSLTAVQVGSVRRVAVASPRYLAEHGVPRTPADLARHDGIGFSQTASANAPWSFHSPRSHGVGGSSGAREIAHPHMQLIANTGELTIAAAMAGRGVTRAVSYQVDADVRAGRLQVVLADYEAPPIPVHIVYPAGRKAAAKVRAFVDFAVQRLRGEAVLSPEGLGR